MKVIDLIKRLQQLPPEGDVRLTERDLNRLFGRLEAEKIRKEVELREFVLGAWRLRLDYQSLGQALGYEMVRRFGRVMSPRDNDVDLWVELFRKDIVKVGGEGNYLAKYGISRSTPCTR